RLFYDALRAPDPSASATSGSFRPAPALLLLVTRLHWDPTGQPLVPGNLEVWKVVLRQKSDSHIVREWGSRSTHLTTADQLMQLMFAVPGGMTDDGVAQIYIAV